MADPARDMLETGPEAGGAPSTLVVLAGFMGTGKTETGRALADLLGYDFLDTDALIEKQEGCTIPEIFESRGETRFRTLEKALCRRLVERDHTVAAVGGGLVTDPDNLALLARHAALVLLEASVDAILGRVGEGRGRPMLAGAHTPGELRARIQALLEARRPAYHRIPLRIDTTDLTPRQAACSIAARLDLPSHVLEYRVPPGAMKHRPPAAREGRAPAPVTRIEIGRGLLSHLGDRIQNLGAPEKVFLFVPRTVAELHLDQAKASLEEAGLPYDMILLRDGDPEKNLDQASELLSALADKGAVRGSLAACMGGGVTGDLGGFAAAIYMRGLPLVQVPTTLLAQVDASIGGKVGVNLPRAKNLAGAFHPPLLVLSDPCVLRTLPDREISNGLAEVVKTAVLGSEELFRHMEEHLSQSPEKKRRDPAFLECCVIACAKVKAAIVERDPFERGERCLLNLGHTVGHALEAMGSYHSLSHGEAVSIGTVFAARLAERLGKAEAGLADRIARLLDRCGLPVTLPPIDPEAFLAALRLDKKRSESHIKFILPRGIGDALIEPVDWKSLLNDSMT